MTSGPLRSVRPAAHGEGADGDDSWVLLAVTGLVGVVIGVLVLAYPEPGVKLLGVFLGIDLLVAGALLIVHGLSSRYDAAFGPTRILLGMLALVAGLLVVRNPGESVVLVAIAFASFLVVAGAVALGHGLVHREGRWLALGRGVLMVAAGTVILAWPSIGLRTLAVVAGIALVLQGGLDLGEALHLRSTRAAREG